MFEDSLMESGGKIKTKSKWFSILAFVVNSSILIGLILWPLLHPEALPKQMMATKKEKAKPYEPKPKPMPARREKPDWAERHQR